MEELATRLIQSFVSMRTKVIPLSLEQIGRQAGAAVAVVESKGRTESGHRNAFLHRGRDGISPCAMRSIESLFEKWRQHEIGEFWMTLEGLFDLAEKHAANNATPSPHQGDTAIIELPLVLLSGGAHQHIPLGVRDYLRSVEGLAYVLDYPAAFPFDSRIGPTQFGRGRDALIFKRRDHSCVHRFG